MDIEKYLSLNNAQGQIDRLAKKYKNKKLVVYGAGEYFEFIEKNYDLSKLNIVAISDLKFASDKSLNSTKYLPLAPEELKEFDFDVLIMALVYDVEVADVLDRDIFKGGKKMIPLVYPTFSYIIKLLIS